VAVAARACPSIGLMWVGGGLIGWADHELGVRLSAMA
jgi:hypothetical protein